MLLMEPGRKTPFGVASKMNDMDVIQQEMSLDLFCFGLFFLDRPKVRLPRFLRQRYVVQVGDKVNLTIPFTVS